MVSQKCFVIGPVTRIVGGVVGKVKVREWREYLEREGQAPLFAPAEVNCVLRATRVVPPLDPSSEIEFQLERVEQRVPELNPAEESVENDLLGMSPKEGSWDLVETLTRELPVRAQGQQVIGKLRFESLNGAKSAVYAVGALALTALQELLNSVRSGVKIEYADPPEWRSSSPGFLLETRNGMIARALVDRVGLQGSERDDAMLRLMLPFGNGARPFSVKEPFADVHWAYELNGFETGGRFWPDLRQPRHEFFEACRRFTFQDVFDHCPESHKEFQLSPGYGAYQLWYFEIDLMDWTLRPLTEESYARMQTSRDCLDRWIAAFGEPTPPPRRIAYFTSNLCKNCRLPLPDEPFRVEL